MKIFWIKNNLYISFSDKIVHKLNREDISKLYGEITNHFHIMSVIDFDRIKIPMGQEWWE